MARYYLVAGEASGDLHGANLIKALRTLDPDSTFTGVGGDVMEAEGMTLDKHYKDVAYMGFIEVIRHLRKIKLHLRKTSQIINEGNFDAVILIDYPGFNLRLAKAIRSNTKKIIYYISPQVWAWKANRVEQMKKLIDETITILPFEKPFFKKYGMDVKYVGHPLLDHIEFTPDTSVSMAFSSYRKIALLPGSRKQEIQRMLPVMLEFAERRPELDFRIVQHPSIPDAFYARYLRKQSNVFLDKSGTAEILKASDFAFVTSGTATLETALYNIPQIVLYKANPLSYHIAKRLVKVKYISLVNLILDKAAVRELIQHECTLEEIRKEFRRLENPESQKLLGQDYSELRMKLEEKGASLRAARIIQDAV